MFFRISAHLEVHDTRDKQSDGIIKKVVFKFPVFIDGQLADTVMLTKKSTDETVVSLSLKSDSPKIEVSMKPGEDSLYEPQDKGAYEKIKAYVLEKYGFKVSSLYIAQTKDKCGLDI